MAAGAAGAAVKGRTGSRVAMELKLVSRTLDEGEAAVGGGSLTRTAHAAEVGESLALL